MQRQEVDTFLLGVLHLLQTCRHLNLRTTINECYLSTQTLGCTTRVHSGVTTTHNEYALSWVQRGISSRISSIHQVHTGQILVRRHDIDAVLTRDIHEVRQTSARANEDTLEALSLQLFNADGLAHDDVSLEMNTHLGEVLDLHIHNLIRQTELGDTILQHTTDLVQCFKYINIITLLHHIASEAQSSRTRTYDGNLDAIGRCDLRQRDIATLTFEVGCETLQITDSHSGLIHLQMDTLALALLLLWTDTTADSGEGRGVLQHLCSSQELTALDILNE